MRHHGRLSRAYRTSTSGRVYDSKLVAADMRARSMFCVATILRNGPRILRACEAVAKELEAEYAQSD